MFTGEKSNVFLVVLYIGTDYSLGSRAILGCRVQLPKRKKRFYGTVAVNSVASEVISTDQVSSISVKNFPFVLKSI
jgi:hypothetical protein